MGLGGSLCEQWSDAVEEGRRSAPSKALTQTSPSPALAPANTQSPLGESKRAVHTPDNKMKRDFQSINMTSA